MTMKKVLEMKAKREDARLKAMAVLNKAEAEDRFLTGEEQKEIDGCESEIRSWDESISRAEKLLAIEPEDRSATEKPEVKPTPSKGEEKRFATFGEQLLAAYRAAAPGGKVDERLTTRAASGLNESTPSDGGFLVQQDFVSGFFTKIWDGIKSVCGGIWDSVTGVFGKIKDFFTGQSGEATSWGSNLISNITGGIKKAANWVVDGVKSVGKSIANFLGFGSPTKKGPGHKADEWIPNLMDMMADGLYADIPMVQRAAIEVANTLGLATSPNRAMVGTGTSPNGDLLNGLLQGMMAMNGMGGSDEKELVMQIDGQTFARLMLPKLSREYKRNGVNLQGV